MEKINEPKLMRELHEIRAEHYEETKHMTSEELTKSINEEARKIAEKHNLKFEFVNRH
ncbi:MAG: hypothetical protein GXY86_17190 [Firmicutes bacterium]|nr:hypothetical protein [Bacillota bacterium]